MAGSTADTDSWCRYPDVWLGVTIENMAFVRKYRIFPPKDYEP